MLFFMDLRGVSSCKFVIAKGLWPNSSYQRSYGADESVDLKKPRVAGAFSVYV
jgi:hypothetical protein